MPDSRAPWAVVLDFDGTITVRDVADSILKKFAGTGPGEHRHRTEVVSEAWVYEKYRRVLAPISTLRDFALGSARMRRQFDRLARQCLSAGSPLEIVSGGLDLYVDALLESWGHGWVPRYRATTRQTADGLHVRYRFLKSGTTLDDFKAGRVAHYKRRGHRVLFAGDGPSDFKAARAADLVYARGALWRLCRAAGIPATPLTTFAPVARSAAKGR